MKKILIVFTAALALGGCKKFLDVNTNPNTPTQTNAAYVFTNAEARTVANQVGGVHIMAGSWVGYYGHSTSYTGGGQEKTYVFTNNDFNFWDGMYDNIADYQYVIDHAAADGVPHLVGPSKIMQAYVYQKLVDLYGNIPYSEAMQATTNLAPKYDDAKTVYESLITKIDQAIADIKAATFPGTDIADIQFKGNKTNWIQFANTLKLRILIRQTEVPGRDAYITTNITNIVNEGTGFITDNVYVQPGYAKSSGKLNPFYVNYGFDQNDATTNYAYRKVGATIINFLKSTADSFRLFRLAAPITSFPSGSTINDTLLGSNPPVPDPKDFDNYKGVPLGGDGSGYLEGVTSSIGSEQIVKGDATRPSILMSAAEAYFLKAEAAQRYGIAGLGSVSSNYVSGIKWSFRLAAATYAGTSTATNGDADAAADRYLSRPAYTTWFSSVGQLRAIWIQKYIALMNIDGLEAWSEYRRTNTSTSNGAAPTSPHSVATTSPEPVRLFYPLREQNVNSSNYVNVNVFTNRIFWDVN